MRFIASFYPSEGRRRLAAPDEKHWRQSDVDELEAVLPLNGPKGSAYICRGINEILRQDNSFGDSTC
jgi:hypothetical protein